MADVRKETRELLDRKVDEVFETLQDKYNIDPGDIFLVDAYVADKIEGLVTDLAYYIALMLGEQAGEDDFDAFDDRVGEACDDGKCCEALNMISDMEKYLNKLKADGVNMNKLTAGNKLARQFPGASQSDIAKVVKKCKIKESKCNEDDQPAEAQKCADRVARSLEILARALRRGEISDAIDRLNKILETANNTLAQYEEEVEKPVEESKCEEAKCEEGKKRCPKIVDKKEVTEEVKECKLTEDRSGEYKYTIWSNDTDAIDALVDEIKANPDDFGYDGDESEPVDVDWARDLAYDLNNEYLDDERINLDVDTNDIIAIGDIGRWNGRVKGYKEIGRNISDCLYSDCDYVTWYVDKDDFKCHEIHHDGENYITYRERKNDIDWGDWDEFLDMLYNGTATQEDVEKYTNSLRPQIAQVYGW